MEEGRASVQFQCQQMRIEINSRGKLIFHSQQPGSTFEQSFEKTTNWLSYTKGIYPDGLGKGKVITYHVEIIQIQNRDR